MKHNYGDFTVKQVSDYKKSLHASVHWLLIYKEEEYEFLDKYFTSLLTKISGLNKIFIDDKAILKLMVAIQSAKDESEKDDCDFKLYRKIILDAHSLIDEITEDGD